ncbi:MAG: hypothetical protein CK423_07100 [Legionella sp.]|nr:MAG: hypothetical protein CK423_07100 [Legionella sp.]
MNSFIKTLLPVIVFQIQWWLCILSSNEHAQYGYCVAVIIFLLNLYYQPLTRPMSLFFLLLLSCGIMNDTMLMQIGVFTFSFPMGHFIPAWLMVLWVCFSAWFLHAKWLNQRLLSVLCLFSIGGSGSYYFAVKLNALIFSIPTNRALIILSIDWFCLGLVFFLTVRWMRVLQEEKKPSQ